MLDIVIFFDYVVVQSMILQFWRAYMYSSRILSVIFTLFIMITAPSLFAGENFNQPEIGSEEPAAEREMGLFVDFGSGFTNNLRLSDWMNSLAEMQEVLLMSEEDESTRGEPLLYGGIDIEARFFSGNIVFGPSFGYYDVMQGHREVEGDTVTYKHDLSLSFIALKTSVYYRIGFSDGNFLLLGGGLGYYNGTLKNEWGYYSSSGNDEVNSSEDSCWTIGVHTGLEYNIRLFDSFAISAGFINRFAEAFKFDVDVSNDDDDDNINAGLTGVYLYAGAGYMF